MMTDKLAQPLAWTEWSSDAATKALLDDLQANILKGHGRDHTANLFLAFDGYDPDAARLALAGLAAAMPSALDQLVDAQAFKATGAPGRGVLCFVLTAAGYAALGLDAAMPAGAAFRAGMKASGGKLADPASGGWDTPFDGTVHAMLLIADTTPEKVDAAAGRWTGLLGFGGVRVLGMERGRALRREVAGERVGIENFGYVDGRSQPLFLAEDVAEEPKANWNPAFPPRQFLVPDPGGQGSESFGSYFVFRKLEQNVKGFKDREEDLADALGLAGDDRERAGALVVGRFEDGTPVVAAGDPQNQPPPNDFGFDADPDGKLCPFRAHIRKTNPRGDTERRFGAPLADERGHIMARRGITYGEREQDPATGEPTDRPTGGVGLLFMAYMADVENQFEFTQAAWANNPNFVAEGLGIDPVIGQGTNPFATPWRDERSGGETADFDFSGFVTLKGGEYFFAPSLGFLRNLA
ncbi:MAG: hypothetical protein KDG89_06530 [Geminicoccaceae bacterium]|nr:hypothetical protein [Geminicoccaceae bacterium]